MNPTRIICLLLLTVTSSASAWAQQAVPLRLEFHNDSIPRSNGPMPLDVEMTWGGASLLEGRLVLTFKDGPTIHGRAVSYDMALNVGRNRFQLLLPTLDGKYIYNRVEVRAKFVTEDSEIELDPAPRELRVPPQGGRAFRVLYCDPTASGTNRNVSDLVKSLRVERFWSLSEADQQLRKEQRPERPNLATMADVSSPDEMPQDPHWFCSRDLVILSQAGLTGLRSKQLEALSQWVRAGGSLLIEPMGGLEQRQLDFLNELVGGEKDQYTTGPDGHLDVPPDRDFETFQVGIGRCGLVYQPFTDIDFETPDWAGLTASLWKFRSDQMTAARETGKFEWLPVEQLLPSQSVHREGPGNHYGGYYGNYDVAPRHYSSDTDALKSMDLQSGQGLLDKLMPSEVEVVPLWYIGLILLFYVLTIGPLDYFVLGALKLRRLTWITFPAATIAFTLFTVWLSHTYLDASTERSVLRVFDVDEDGTVLRTNRIELLFTMSSHNVNNELKSSLFTAMSHSRFGGNMYDYRYGRNMVREQVPPPIVQGRPPGVYTAVQEMPQWTPQLNRVLTIAPDPESLPNLPAQFDWKKSWNFSDRDVRRTELAPAIHTAFGNDAQAWLFHEREIHPVTDDQNRTVFPLTSINYNHYSIQNQNLTQSHQQELNSLGQRQTDFLSDVSVRLQGRSLFGVVSQISPHGGDNFEDMTLLDPSDKDKWLLVIVQPLQEDIRIYRHVYHVAEQTSE